MKSCLVMLTKTYPFGSGEEFIENELPFLAEAFGKVILIATSVSGRPEQTRAVPGNVEVRFIPSSQIKHSIPAAVALNFAFPPREFFGAAERGAVGRSLPKRAFFAYFLAKSRRIARESAELLKDTDAGGFDRVTFYSYWFFDTALASLELKENSRARYRACVSRAHGYDLYSSRNRLQYLPLRPYLLERLDEVFPCSQNGADYLKRGYPQWEDKVRTAYLGTRDFGLGPEPAPGEFRLVSCCHIVPLKRVDLLARSLKLLSGGGLKLSWTHFGGGEGLQELTQYAKENLGFMEYSFPGEVRNADLMEFYRKNPADCFVNTSTSEGLPVSIMEACSFGVPVIATNVGGTCEIVRDGENGLILPADLTAETLAAKIREFCAMPADRREAMRRTARNIWQADFSAEDNFRRFAESIARPQAASVSRSANGEE